MVSRSHFGQVAGIPDPRIMAFSLFRMIMLIVIDMATMSVKHMLKAYEARIAVYGASLHQQVGLDLLAKAEQI